MNDKPATTETQDRYERGAEILDGFLTPVWREWAMAPASPASKALARINIEHCYGDSWARDALDFKMRSAITMAAIAAMGGCNEELKLHVRIALSNGFTQEEIIEVFIHLVSYIGVPRIVEATRATGEVFDELAKATKA